MALKNAGTVITLLVEFCEGGGYVPVYIVHTHVLVPVHLCRHTFACTYSI